MTEGYFTHSHSLRYTDETGRFEIWKHDHLGSRGDHLYLEWILVDSDGSVSEWTTLKYVKSSIAWRRDRCKTQPVWPDADPIFVPNVKLKKVS